MVETSNAQAFARFGDEKHLLTDDEKRELAADKGQVQTELQPAPDYTFPDDFNLELIRTFADAFREDRGLDHQRLSDLEVLRQRHLGKVIAAQFQPNLAGVLLFANDPLATIPGCKIQVIRYEGEQVLTGERDNVVKQEWFEGNIPTIIGNTAKFLDSQIRDFQKRDKNNKFQSGRCPEGC